MSFCVFAQLVTTSIFFSTWDKSRVKWDNSRNSTQKIRTLDCTALCALAVNICQEQNWALNVYHQCNAFVIFVKNISDHFESFKHQNKSYNIACRNEMCKHHIADIYQLAPIAMPTLKCFPCISFQQHCKVCIIRLVHIYFEKSSSTFWQVRCCAHRTRRSCQKYDEDFFKFCVLLRKPKLYHTDIRFWV